MGGSGCKSFSKDELEAYLMIPWYILVGMNSPRISISVNPWEKEPLIKKAVGKPKAGRVAVPGIMMCWGVSF